MPHRTLFTIGHSTRSWEEFVQLLAAWKIRRLIDVRSIPRSAKVPQFSKEKMKTALAKAGIEYWHLILLGGLRHTTKQSINTGWRNASFRGYADYMQTPDFDTGLAELNRLARAKRTAIMCAEAKWWSCHRRMIADAELVRGIPVRHIMTPQQARSHNLTPFARVRRRRGAPPTVTYPASELPARAMPAPALVRERRGPRAKR